MTSSVTGYALLKLIGLFPSNSTPKQPLAIILVSSCIFVVLISGTLESNGSVTYNLRIWIDEEAPNTEQNKVFA